MGKGAPPRRRRRWLRRLLLATVGLIAVLTVIALTGIGTHARRRAILGWVTAAVEKRAGVRVTATDFSLAVGRGVLELEGLSLSSVEPGARPFASAERARIDLDWRELSGDPARIESVRLDRVHVDLDAPLPASRSGTGKTESGAAHGFEVGEIVLTDAAIDGHALSEAFDIVGDFWHAREVELHGSYRMGRLEVERSRMRVVLEGGRRPTVEGTLVARFALDGDGGFEVDSLELVAEGLSLSANSTGNLREPTISELHFELEANPAQLVPDLTASCHVKALGTVAPDRAAISGSLRVDVERFPAELLQPALRAMDPTVLDPAGSWLDRRSIPPSRWSTG